MNDTITNANNLQIDHGKNNGQSDCDEEDSKSVFNLKCYRRARRRQVTLKIKLQNLFDKM